MKTKKIVSKTYILPTIEYRDISVEYGYASSKVETITGEYSGSDGNEPYNPDGEFSW